MTCPPPNLWEARRACFLVSFMEDDMSFTPIPMSELQVGDVYVLEASKPHHDVLEGVATERMFRVVAEPYHVDGVCQVDSIRI